ncbi:hypothetical protein GLOIN_2v1771895 [Rhizophagus clarus]|uniref:Ion transport domain-containing protein n=1 Tax=Rhizophagus clarus TaxID=94130 RepID=A0A8H3KNB7_9GLOM|nr:hypothetical protein GLOIN_2v1771895 [Rhizophagus clarus]
MAQNLPSQKIHTTEITALTISQDGKFIASFSKLDEIVALWQYPTGSNTPITLELNYLKKNKKIDIKTIIDTKKKITCEFDLTMSKNLSCNRLFIILYSSEQDKPMVLDEEMEYLSPDCLKNVFGRAQFLADGETLGIYNNKTVHVISVKSWPWTLLRRIDIQNNDFQVFTFNPLTNKNYFIFRQWEPHNVFDIIDIDTYKCHLRVMPKHTPGETTYTISNMCISPAGDLLAFKTSLGALHVYDLGSGLAIMSKKLIFPYDFRFVNGGKNLLIINFVKENEQIIATLCNARSGTELVSVALSALSQCNTKNVRIINDEQILIVLSHPNDNILVVEEWNWVNVFHKQQIQYTDIPTSNYRNEDDCDLITGYKVGKYQYFLSSVKSIKDFSNVNVPPGKLVLNENYNEYSISSNSLQIRLARGVKPFFIDEQNIILVSPRIIVLFCVIDNDKIDLRKLVWRLPQNLPDINKFSYRCINNFSQKRILWFDITCGNNMQNYYTIIPLDVAISGHDLPDEWMQHSCECQGPINFLNLLSVKPYTHCNTFNSAKTMCNLIRYKTTQRDDECAPTAILEEILQNNHYKPTIGPNGENPLTVAILEFKSAEIHKLLDYCIYHCIHDGQPGFMSIVVDALPELARHYPKILDKLMKQCTYVKIPSIWKLKSENHDSIHENLWSYKFDGSIFMANPKKKTNSKKKFLDTLFDKWERIIRHSATHCFVPLPGLCTYPESSHTCHWFTIFLDTLIPRHLSIFVKLTLFRPFESFKSPPFEAIVKFKWHAFARWRFFQLFFLYLVHFGLFVSAISTNREQLVIASMILGIILTITWIRRSIIYYVNDIRFFTVFATYVEFAAFALPVITGSLKHGGNVAPPELQSLSVFSLWIFIVAQLCVVFKEIGIIIADSDNSNTFTSFGSSLDNVWSMVLGDYDSLKPWTNNVLVIIYTIIFSFSTAIILVNILIAILNDIYEETNNYANTVWVIRRAEIIVDIELSWMIPSERQNRDYFPWSIIYEASTEDVDEWSKRFNTPIQCEIKDDMKGEIAKLKDDMKGEIAKLKDEMKGEIAKLKDEMKDEIAKMKDRNEG